MQLQITKYDVRRMTLVLGAAVLFNSAISLFITIPFGVHMCLIGMGIAFASFIIYFKYKLKIIDKTRIMMGIFFLMLTVTIGVYYYLNP